MSPDTFRGDACVMPVWESGSGREVLLLYSIAHYSWRVCNFAPDGVSWKHLSSFRSRAQHVFRSSVPGCMALEQWNTVRWEVGAWAEEVLLETGATPEIYLARVVGVVGRRMALAVRVAAHG